MPFPSKEQLERNVCPEHGLILSWPLVLIVIVAAILAAMFVTSHPSITPAPIVEIMAPKEEPKEELPAPVQAPRDMETMIRWEAATYGINPDVAVAIARCESGLDPYAANPNSTAKGIYQFLDGTWEAIKAQGHQFDAEENIKQFMIWYPIHPEWWECE